MTASEIWNAQLLHVKLDHTTNKDTLLYRILCLVVFFIMLKPAWFGQFNVINVTFTVLQLAIYLCAALICIIKRIPILSLIVIMYFIILNISTLANRQDLTSSIRQSIACIGATMVICLLFKYMPIAAWSGLLLVLEVLIYCNFISALLAPMGLYRLTQPSGWWTDANWFLGIRNGMAPTYCLAALLQVANVRVSSNSTVARFRAIVFFVIATGSIYLINKNSSGISAATTSGSLTIIWTAILLFPVITRISVLRKYITFANAVILNIIISLAIVVFRLQHYFSFIIVDLLGKDLTLTSRTEIWDNAIAIWKHHIFWGVGVQYPLSMAENLRNVAATSTTQNGWLDVAYFAGVVGLAGVILLLIYVSYNLQSKKLDLREINILGYFTFVYLLTGQGEGLVGLRFFILMSLVLAIASVFKSQSGAMG